MEKRHLDRRLAQMEAEGTEFACGVDVGADVDRGRSCAASSTPSCWPAARRVARDLPVPGRELDGIHQAMEFLPLANRRAGCGDARTTPPISAAGKHVVIIGGGDTGADCLGTAHRQGAASVTQLEIMPQPPEPRAGQPAVADLPDDLPGLHRARGGRRAACTPSPPRSSSATRPGTCAALRLVEVRVRRRQVRAGAGHRAGAARRPGAAGHGLHRAGAGRAARPTSAWSSTRAATWPATATTRPRCRASSSPATWAAASR